MSVRTYGLFVCDLQTRFRTIIRNFPLVLRSSQTLIDISNKLNIPICVTEQNPSKLGNTCPELTEKLNLSKDVIILPKMQFSMIIEEVNTFITRNGFDTVILCGIEGHVCIQQTALDLLDRKINVIIPLESVSSQRAEDLDASLRLLLQRGATVTTIESAVMTILKSADHPQFRDVMKIMIKHTEDVKELRSSPTTHNNKLE